MADIKFKGADLKAGRQALGLSAAKFAVWVNVADGRTVRRWEADDREIPGPVVVLLRAALESAAVREYFGLTLNGGGTDDPA